MLRLPLMSTLACTVLLSCALANAAPAAAPTSAPAKDLLKGALDPYDSPAQRVAFLSAAGKDGEMTAEGFAADLKAGKGFARSFDTWAELLKFDKNKNGTIDWFEAEAYRMNIRLRLLAAFDANNDGKLTGAERDAANAALAAGKIPVGKTSSPRLVPQDRAEALKRYVGGRDELNAGIFKEMKAKSFAQLNDLQQVEYFRKFNKANTKLFVKAFDLDGDGKVSPQENAQASKAIMEEYGRQTLAKWDANHNGQIDQEEAKAMQDDAMKKAEVYKKQFMLDKYDTNHNGKIDADEQKSFDQDQAEQNKRFQDRYKKILALWDKDGDGKLSADESRAMSEAQQKAVKKWQEKYLKTADLDKDGKVSEDEDAEYRMKMIRKYDSNGDGKLTADEREKMMNDMYDYRSGGFW